MKWHTRISGLNKILRKYRDTDFGAQPNKFEQVKEELASLLQKNAKRLTAVVKDAFGETDAESFSEEYQRLINEIEEAFDVDSLDYALSLLYDTFDYFRIWVDWD